MLVHPVIAESCATALERPAAADPPDTDLPLSALRDADLLQRFAGVSDGRHDQGRDHPVAVVLVLCAAAVLGGMRSFTAIAGRVADVPVVLLDMLHRRGSCDRTAGGRQVAAFPSKTTLWRVLTGADPAAVNAAIGAWLLTQVAQATVEHAVEHAAEHAEERLGESGTPPGVEGSSLLGVAVDGKAVRVRGRHRRRADPSARRGHPRRATRPGPGPGRGQVQRAVRPLSRRPGVRKTSSCPVGSTPCDLGADESVNELGAGASGRRPGVLPVST